MSDWVELRRLLRVGPITRLEARNGNGRGLMKQSDEGTDYNLGQTGSKIFRDIKTKFARGGDRSPELLH